MLLSRVLLALAVLAAPQAATGFSITITTGNAGCSLLTRAPAVGHFGRASSPLFSLRMMSSDIEDGEPEQKMSRAQRRMAEKANKKSTTGGSKTLTQAPGGMRASKSQEGKTPVKSKLVEVMSLDDLPAEEGARKSIEIEGTDPKRVVMMMRHKGKVMALNPGCTKCKFPLLGADLDGNQIRCKVCGSAWKLPNGEVVEGTEGTIMSGLFKSMDQTPLPIFATKTMANKIYMGIAL